MEQALLSLISLLKAASPVVWEAAIRQVLVVAYTELFFGILVLVSAIISATCLVKMYRAYAEVEAAHGYDLKEAVRAKYAVALHWKDDIGEFMLWAWLIVFSIIGIVNVASAVMHLSNPVWYAIEWLLSAATGG